LLSLCAVNQALCRAARTTLVELMVDCLGECTERLPIYGFALSATPTGFKRFPSISLHFDCAAVSNQPPMITPHKLDRRFSVAPMMDWTNSLCM